MAGARSMPRTWPRSPSRLAKSSSAFPLDEIVARALERRGRALGLRSGTSDLLMLMEGDVKPLEAMLLPDDAFRGLVAKMEEELGDLDPNGAGALRSFVSSLEGRTSCRPY